MKELEQQNKIHKEIKVVKPIQKQAVLLDTLNPKKGHKCFEINKITGEIKEAEFTSENKHYVLQGNLKGYVKKRLDVKEDCVYITALNKKNALKKYDNDKK